MFLLYSISISISIYTITEKIVRFFIIFVILLFNYAHCSNAWADAEIQPDNTTIDSFTLSYLYDETGQDTINEISRKDFPLQINNRFTQGYLEGNS